MDIEIRNMKILVVDDSEGLTLSISRYFTSRNFEVHTTDRLQPALELLNSHSFDVALVDLRLGDSITNGMTLIRKINRSHPDTNVIIITGYASLETAISALQNGVADYLVKPFKMVELYRRINRIIEIRGNVKFRKNSHQLDTINQISTTLGHEINNPLTTIIGYAQILISDCEELSRDEIKKSLQIIEDQALRIRSVTQKITSLQKARLIDYVAGSKMIDINGFEKTHSRGMM